jgi:hypothetical protein
MVMLLTIYVIEQGLFNGATIGRIVKSVYIKKQGAQLAYVVVDFEKNPRYLRSRHGTQ